MKRVLLVALCIIVFISSFSFLASASQVTPNEGADIGVVPYALIAEPPELPSTCYFVLDNPGSYSSNIDRINNSFLFILVFPYVFEPSTFADNITVTLELKALMQTLIVSSPSMPGLPFYCYVYRLSGSFVNKYSWTTTSDPDGFKYTFTFLPNVSRYWSKGPISVVVKYDNYRPANIIWSGDSVYTTQLRDIMIQLNQIFAGEAALGNQMQTYNNQQLAAINSFHSDFTDMFDAYNTVFENYMDHQQSVLSTINSKLSGILDLLGQGQTIPTIADNPELSSGVSDYVVAEDSYLDSMSSHVGQFGTQVDQIGTQLNSLSGGFSAVKLMFENFVLNSNFPSFIILFFSLVFGVFILILGKRVN